MRLREPMPDQLLDVRLRLLRGQAGPSQSASYAFLAFDAPRLYAGLAATLELESEALVQLPMALFDPAGRIRYMKASEPASGRLRLSGRIDVAGAEPGAVPGPVEAGSWKLVLHKRILPRELAVRITVAAQGQPRSGGPRYALDGLAFADAVADPRPGWYCGELHLHSSESTGRTSVEVIRDAALARGLDFLALTDHYAASHWLRIEEKATAGRRPLFLRSMEIAGGRGHANLHGLTGWIDPFVDDDGALAAFLGASGTGSMEGAAERVHGMGGLFCVNHPLSGAVAWRYDGFPMEQADLLEVVCLADGPPSFLYPTLWDRFLCAGLRITGVGSSDSHDPLQEGPWGLGQVRNWVSASSLSRDGILSGLMRGQAYVALGRTRLELSAVAADGAQHGMGDTILLADGQCARFRAALSSHPSGNLFIIKDGLIHDIVAMEAGDGPDAFDFVLTSSDLKASGQSYVRLELHEDLEKARYHGMAWRDHRSLRLLSNPIWLVRAGR